MEPPSDIAYLDVEAPGAPLVLAEPASHPERLRSCDGAIAGRLSQAKSPAILAGQDVDRYGAAAEVVGRADTLQMPVAVIGPAKAVIDETFPCYAGITTAREAIRAPVRPARPGTACCPSATGR